jgi:uncharacterized protein YoxC
MSTKVKQNDELVNEVANLSTSIEQLNYLLKSDFTQWNIVEAIENLSFELKRLNDREEAKK